MTYRIIEGELYTVVESSVCHVNRIPCVFAVHDVTGYPRVCERVLPQDPTLRPCTEPPGSNVFFTDDLLTRYIAARLRS